MVKTTGGKKATGTGSNEPEQTTRVSAARSPSSAGKRSAESSSAESVTSVARKRASTSSAARAASVTSKSVASVEKRQGVRSEREADVAQDDAAPRESLV